MILGKLQIFFQMFSQISRNPDFERSLRVKRCGLYASVYVHSTFFYVLSVALVKLAKISSLSLTSYKKLKEMLQPEEIQNTGSVWLKTTLTVL